MGGPKNKNWIHFELIYILLLLWLTFSKNYFSVVILDSGALLFCVRTDCVFFGEQVALLFFCTVNGAGPESIKKLEPLR
jgi:hypothetical protein